MDRDEIIRTLLTKDPVFEKIFNEGQLANLTREEIRTAKAKFVETFPESGSFMAFYNSLNPTVNQPAAQLSGDVMIQTLLAKHDVYKKLFTDGTEWASLTPEEQQQADQIIVETFPDFANFGAFFNSLNSVRNQPAAQAPGDVMIQILLAKHLVYQKLFRDGTEWLHLTPEEQKQAVDIYSQTFPNKANFQKFYETWYTEKNLPGTGNNMNKDPEESNMTTQDSKKTPKLKLGSHHLELLHIKGVEKTFPDSKAAHYLRFRNHIALNQRMNDYARLALKKKVLLANPAANGELVNNSFTEKLDFENEAKAAITLTTWDNMLDLNSNAEFPAKKRAVPMEQ